MTAHNLLIKKKKKEKEKELPTLYGLKNTLFWGAKIT